MLKTKIKDIFYPGEYHSSRAISMKEFFSLSRATYRGCYEAKKTKSAVKSFKTHNVDFATP